MAAPRAMAGQEPGGWTGFPGTPRPQRLQGSGCWQRSEVARPGQLGIDKGDGDVAGALGGGESLVVVRESPGVHEGPALPWGSDRAVVAQEATATALGDRKCQFPHRSQFPNRKPALPPQCPILPSEPPQPSGPEHGLPGMPCRVTAIAA